MSQKTDKEISEELQRKGHLAFGWDDLDKIELPTGVVTSTFRVGDPLDETSPTIFKAFYPPGCYIEAHTHDCDYTEIILEGSQKVGAKWFKAGDVRIGLANRGYGPLLAGEEGATVLFIFKDNRWPAIAIGKNDGSTLRSDVISDHFAEKNEAAQ